MNFFQRPSAGWASLAVCFCALCVLPLHAQDGPSDVITLNRLPISDDLPAPAPREADPRPADEPPPPPSPHPLLPALKIAYNSHEFLTNNIKDYSCRVVKQERLDGRLLPMEYVDAKVRHEWTAGGRVVHPRSLYLKFLAPEEAAGREVLWVEGANDGKMIVRRGGRRFNYVTVELDPQSEPAMRDSNYPVMDSGMKTMVRKLIDIALADMKYGECEVQFFHDVKIDGRACLCIQVTHPRPRTQFKFHIARVFVDDEHPIPLRYEAYDWPKAEGEAPPLLEQFTFQHVKLNVGFSDAEFRRDYSEYNFRE
jgi:hypothetical protein